jgi:hypothetical protein
MSLESLLRAKPLIFMASTATRQCWSINRRESLWRKSRRTLLIRSWCRARLPAALRRLALLRMHLLSLRFATLILLREALSERGPAMMEPSDRAANAVIPRSIPMATEGTPLPLDGYGISSEKLTYHLPQTRRTVASRRRAPCGRGRCQRVLMLPIPCSLRRFPRMATPPTSPKDQVRLSYFFCERNRGYPGFSPALDLRKKAAKARSSRRSALRWHTQFILAGARPARRISVSCRHWLANPMWTPLRHASRRCSNAAL